MIFDTLKRNIEFETQEDRWARAFRKAWATPLGLHCQWMTPEQIDAACEYLDFPQDVRNACVRAARRIKDNALLREFSWSLYHHLYVDSSPDEYRITKFPKLPGYLGTEAGLLYACVFLAGIEHVRKEHRMLEIPEAITRDTLGDLLNWINIHRKRYGQIGFSEPHWIVRHMRSEVFKLGRLQFEFKPLDLDVEIFANAAGEVQTLAHSGLTIRTDGQYQGVNGWNDNDAWNTEFHRDRTSVTGHPVNTSGGFSRKKVTLDLSSWRSVAHKGDTQLFLHIPSGEFAGELSREACLDSFSRAETFFAKHFPDRDYSIYWTQSWLLDSQLRDVLDDSSRILEFQDLFTAVPLKDTNDKQTFDFAFGVKDDRSLDQFPQNTTLQKRMIAAMKNGTRYRKTGGVRLRS